jgi:hypothetical protein
MQESQPGTYLVEVTPRERATAGTLGERARSSATTVRLLRSIYVPEDDRWFLLYEGTSTADVARAVEQADAHVVSVAVARPANPKEEQ